MMNEELKELKKLVGQKLNDSYNDIICAIECDDNDRVYLGDISKNPYDSNYTVYVFTEKSDKMYTLTLKAIYDEEDFAIEDYEIIDVED